MSFIWFIICILCIFISLFGFIIYGFITKDDSYERKRTKFLKKYKFEEYNLYYEKNNKELHVTCNSEDFEFRRSSKRDINAINKWLFKNLEKLEYVKTCKKLSLDYKELLK